MTVAAASRTIAKTSATETGQPAGWEPRASERSWWQPRQSREALTARLLGSFTDPSAGRIRDKTRRRGMTKLLDWLQRQPGDTWQERWLASGADSAGFDWAAECRPVRELLVEYLTERSPELDHTSLRSVARNLCRLFWRDLEIHHPGIESLRLPAEVAQAWKERLAHIRDTDGRPVRARVNYRSELVFVRAFYEDIARWAADDPSRWAPWVAPCPIRRPK